MSTVSNVSESVRQGEDRSLVYTITDSAGAAQNVTGWTVQWKCRHESSSSVALTKSASLTTPASGIVTVSLSASDTTALSLGRYLIQLWRTDSGYATQLSEGVMEVRRPAALVGT